MAMESALSLAAFPGTIPSLMSGSVRTLPSLVSHEISPDLRHFPVLVRRVSDAFERGYAELAG